MTVNLAGVITTPILVVDDSPTCLYLACSLLENLGMRCISSTTFAQAVQLAMTHRPQLALIDLVMPEGHGALLSAQLHALNPHILTYAVSASDPQDLACPPGLDGQFSGTLSKPVCAVSLSRFARAQQTTQTLQTTAEGLGQRLLSLPDHQRKVFLKMLYQDLNDVTLLLQRSKTHAQQQQCVHRLAGIFSAAAASELTETKAIEQQLKQGKDLTQVELSDLTRLIASVELCIERVDLKMAF